jgi:Uma2 family endonuclease
MASPARVDKRITLEEFLRLPEIDEHPYLEYVDGGIEAKVSPQKKHGLLEKRLMNHMDAHAEPRLLGQTFPELRRTFAGRSIIPDVAFLLDEHIETDERGEVVGPTLRPPDIHVEIISPDQSVRKCREKLVFSTANGCPLGWLIDPSPKTVSVYRPGLGPERLAADGVLDGDPVLVGYRVPVATVFGWLKLRGAESHPASGPGSSSPGEPTG